MSNLPQCLPFSLFSFSQCRVYLTNILFSCPLSVSGFEGYQYHQPKGVGLKKWTGGKFSRASENQNTPPKGWRGPRKNALIALGLYHQLSFVFPAIMLVLLSLSSLPRGAESINNAARNIWSSGPFPPPALARPKCYPVLN